MIISKNLLLLKGLLTVIIVSNIICINSVFANKTKAQGNNEPMISSSSVLFGGEQESEEKSSNESSLGSNDPSGHFVPFFVFSTRSSSSSDSGSSSLTVPINNEEKKEDSMSQPGQEEEKEKEEGKAPLVEAAGSMDKKRVEKLLKDKSLSQEIIGDALVAAVGTTPGYFERQLKEDIPGGAVTTIRSFVNVDIGSQDAIIKML